MRNHSASRWSLLALLALALCTTTRGATVTTTPNTPLNQSTADVLQGLIGVLSSGASIQVGTLAGLTDAASATTPDADQYFDPNSSVTITYDLGVLDAATRELAAVSIWLKSGDPHRVDYAGGVAVSLDGVIFTEVASTPRVEFTSGTPSFSHVLYSFAPNEVVGFRYLRIRDEAVFQDQGTTFGTGPYHPRIVEFDAFIPEPTSALLCLLAAPLLATRRRK